MTAAEILKALVDMRDAEAKVAKGGDNYDAVRHVRRNSDALWKQARELVYGPEEPQNAEPHSKTEAERWKRNAERVAVKRNDEVAFADAKRKQRQRGQDDHAAD
jgi:hypothetical protein